MNEPRRKLLRTGAAGLLLAISLRLFCGGVFSSPGMGTSLLVFLQTGRLVRPPGTQVFQPGPVPTDPTVPIPSTEAFLPVFSGSDLDLVEVTYGCGYRPALAPLLTAPLSWDLRGPGPKVLILHTHATECYTPEPGEEYAQFDPYRTLDETQNMLSIGDRVAQLLTEGGIGVIHDRTVHDYPSYNDSYGNARQTIQAQLAAHPEICLVLDIHRDASDGVGGQLVTLGTVDGQRSAQLMMVVGTDETGNPHPNWRENLALALKLSVRLEQTYPGLTRPVNLREHRFNMDLTPGSLIVEVGGAGNTHAEAMRAAEALARAILSLAAGANGA